MNSSSFSRGLVPSLWLVAAALSGAAVGGLVRAPAVRVGNRLPAPTSSALPGQPAAKPSALALRLDSLNAGTPAQQLTAALHLAELGTVEEIRALLDHAHVFPKNAAGGLAVQVLLRRWLELDAAGALAYADLRQHAAWTGLLAAFAAAHPSEAETYWRAVPAGQAKLAGWDGLCAGLLSRQPAEAWRLLDEASDGNEAMVRKLAALDIEDTLARLPGLPGEWKSLARKVIAAELMKQNPARALAWIASQADQRELMAEAVAVTYRRDPGKAFEMLAGLSERDRNRVLGNMTSPKGWRSGYPGIELSHAGTGQDRAALATAVMNSPLNENDRKSLLNDFFWQDPGRGQAFWGYFNEAAQLGRLPAYLYRWSAVDKAAAEAWWRGLPPGPVRTAAEAHWQELDAAWNQQGETEAGRLLMTIRSGNPPRAADSRMAELTPGALSGLVAAFRQPDYYRIKQLVTAVGASNPEAVAGWMEQISVTPESGDTVAEFSARWALDDPVAAAAWVSRLPEGKLAVTAAYNIARQYQIHDPEGARQWVEHLATQPVREAAGKGLQAAGSELD